MKKNFYLIYTLLLFNFSFADDIIELSLKDAISYALKNNHQNRISKLALDISNAQYNQAIGANYPSLDFSITATRRDEAANFKMNGDITLPETITKTLAFSETLRQTGNIATAQIASNNISGTSNLPLNTNIKIAGRDSAWGSLRLTYPIYTGGKISSIIEQAKINKDIKKQDIKLQDEEIIFNVKKIYLAYVLANKIYKTTYDSFMRMKMVKQLTRRLYENESLNVKKTDYLKTKITVSMMEAELGKIDVNRQIMQSALKNILAVPYTQKIRVIQDDLSFNLLDNSLDLEKLYLQAKTNNPLMKKIKLAIDISKEKIKESKSSYLPTVALFADTTKFYNSYDGGLNTDENNNSWSVGVSASLNIFDGFKNENEILQHRLKEKQLQSQNSLIKDAIIFRLNKAMFENKKSFSNIKSYKNANLDAKENRVLNIKAYRADLVETKDVIEAQIIETKTKVMYYKSVYDYLLSIANISKITGKEL